MQFIDRNEEMRRWDLAVDRGGPAFVVVWGLRRVGKSRLLVVWAAKHRGLYWVAGCG